MSGENQTNDVSTLMTGTGRFVASRRALNFNRSSNLTMGITFGMPVPSGFFLSKDTLSCTADIHWVKFCCIIDLMRLALHLCHRQFSSSSFIAKLGLDRFMFFARFACGLSTHH